MSSSLEKLKRQEKELKESSIIPYIGNKLKEIRKGQGKTKQEFIYGTGLSTFQYYRYERGQNLNTLTLNKILHSAGVSLAEFFKDI